MVAPPSFLTFAILILIVTLILLIKTIIIIVIIILPAELLLYQSIPSLTNLDVTFHLKKKKTFLPMIKAQASLIFLLLTCDARPINDIY